MKQITEFFLEGESLAFYNNIDQRGNLGDM